MFKRQTTGSVVCSSCGSLVGVRDEKCYNCGRRNPGMWGFAPLLRSLGNDLGFVQLVIWGCGALYVISLLLSGSALRMGGGLFGFLAPDLVVLFLLGAAAEGRCSSSAGGGPCSAQAGCTAACFTSSST